jgi:hypothetical protein
VTDLSQLLGDLYADDAPATAPAWSSDEALDDVFESWVPGPSSDASPTERSLVAGAIDEATVEPVEALTAWSVEPEPALVAAMSDRAPAATRWSPSDDDILPVRRARRR